MSVPATNGKLRASLKGMKIGDYIVCKYVGQPNGNLGTFSELGASTANEIPIVLPGISNGSFYFIKVAKGLLIADRVVHSTSWESLNVAKLIQGLPWLTGSIIRSITGGVAYADANGNISTTDKGFGAFPTNNEWDKYIANFPIQLIQNGKTSDDVFNWSKAITRCQETPILSIVASSYRVARPYDSKKVMSWGNYVTSASFQGHGLRPVLEYKE
ncbi:hypothetical protein NV379_02745 [Paenibacillus sp. N1-5-1-14]|uniref:hypothetical protein n=1 Tax=Paenibacillus radicibacter TaxID=2972488 RepID=UPI002158E71C|nr:hypothetical protein [Paenibacillus radicibacter]MCR8641565.1 hypothetical protein [Paenibacillus radicibacter]